ncbi:MAG: hypothetical protein ABMB14_26900, partial [Myxococcota bacterium]
IRLTGIAAPLLNGDYLHDDAFGDTSSPTALGVDLAGGASGGLGDMGLLVGYQWPDRVPVRGVVAGRLPRWPVQLEGRLGMNAAAGRSPEPAFDLVVAVIPALFVRPVVQDN